MTRTAAFFSLALTLAVYWLGLGPFLFVISRTPALADFGGVRDFDSHPLYLLNGIAGYRPAGI